MGKNRHQHTDPPALHPAGQAASQLVQPVDKISLGNRQAVPKC
ncbi:MAG: hypothetical protein RMI90_05115 [Thermoguttaceae bacterium]|nr:hypothetical protein [Thermoguttaceae bacterium]